MSPTVRTRRLLVMLVIGTLLIVQAGPVRGDDGLDSLFGDPGTTLPNLVPDLYFIVVAGTFAFDEQSGTFVPGPPDLLVETAAKNLGPVPLQLTVHNTAGDGSTVVSQCVSWRAVPLCRAERALVGVTANPEAAEFLSRGFIRYELRTLLPSGRIDYSRNGLVRTTETSIFCLKDYRPVQGGEISPSFYTECLGKTAQGISAGWHDKYDFSQPGHRLSLAGLTDGVYGLILALDGDNVLSETTGEDNVLEMRIQLSAGVTQVAVVDRRYRAA